MYEKHPGSPTMSDAALLVSVEDLINMALGPPDENVINYKMIQTILHILARQLRVLEVQVEIRSDTPTASSRSDSSGAKKTPHHKSPLREIKEEKAKSRKKDREQETADIDRDIEEKTVPKGREKAKEKAERAKSKERDDTGRAESKERDTAERAKSKERDDDERAEPKKDKAKRRAKSKDRDGTERAESKERVKFGRSKSTDRVDAGKATSKTIRPLSREREEAELDEAKAKIRAKEKAEREKSRGRERAVRAAMRDREAAERAQSLERKRALEAAIKYKEKSERDESRWRQKQAHAADKLAARERARLARAAAKEQEEEEAKERDRVDKAERAASKERKRALKEKAREEEASALDQEEKMKKMEKMDAKDKARAEKMDAKEREKAEKEKEKLSKMSAKEREKYEKEKEKLEKMDAKEREKAEKEKAKLEKMSAKDRDKAEKEKQKLEKMDPKDREKYEKEREKMEKMDAKEREKAEREKGKLEKMSAKDREKAEKEKQKLEKMDPKDREKYEKEKAKEKEKAEKAMLEKMDPKDREKYEKEKRTQKDKDTDKAEREREKLAKMDPKDREKYEREKEKLKDMDPKDREKYEREREKMEKMDPEDRERYEREREALEKMSPKEREKAEREQEKAERAAAKDKEKMDKMSPSERKAYEDELAKQKAKEGAAKGKTGISVKEKDKVLIVEKGPTTRTDSRTRVGSIEVVTQSQFELLVAAVNDLKEKAGPLPFPSLPDNQKLRSQLAKGSASLTDTMQAMQIAARVQAAETAIGRMAGLLTQLAAAGALPKDVAGKLDSVKAEMDAIAAEAQAQGQAQGTKQAMPTGPARKSVAIDPMSKKASTTSKVDSKPSPMGARPSLSSRPSVTSRGSVGGTGVTHFELESAIRSLRDDLTKNANQLSMKASAAADGASATAKAVADKLEIAMKLNTRIGSLFSLVTDYAEQLNGFDAGLATQMQSFQEQMVQMRGDLKSGVTLLESANNNAETAAMVELNERYEGLVSDLDDTLREHQALTAFQNQLSEELRSLLECVEMLREQKADREEVQDGLRDKADNSRLNGLLTEEDFAEARAELEKRLDLCYDKFKRQEQVWMGAVRDLTEVAEGKAELLQLLAARDEAQRTLRDIQAKLHLLEMMLGEPKAALLTRKLSINGRCGACLVNALQDPIELHAGPPRLPALRPPPVGEEPCVPVFRPIDDREHTCNRWVGGSHTLVGPNVARDKAVEVKPLGRPSKRYIGYGRDGKSYYMEDEVQPCPECDRYMEMDKEQPEQPPEPVAQAGGAGDTGLTQIDLEIPA